MIVFHHKSLTGMRKLSIFGLLLLGGCASQEPPSPDSPSPTTESAGLTFTEVTQEAGLADFRQSTGAAGNRWFPESMGSGGGFIDFNGDSWADIALMGGGNWQLDPSETSPQTNTIRIYRNNKDGTFTDVTSMLGLLDFSAYGIGLTAADFDNDGDEDLFVSTLGQNLFFRNENGERYTDITAQAGLADESYWSSSALFFDADVDGYLDLYVGNYVDWSPENDITCMLEGMIRSYCTPELYNGVPANFYRNNGDGTFANWSEKAGFANSPGKTLGVAEYDINRDGWPDIFVANDTQPDHFYQNNGDGTFSEQGALSGMAYDENGKARAGMGIDIGVVDNSGEPTLFVGNFSKEMISAFRHAGDGLFVDRAAISQIGRSSLVTLTFGLFLFDVDLDGDLDLFAANGHVQPEIEETQEGIKYSETPHLFINNGLGSFEDIGLDAGDLNQTFVGRGTAYADYDHDGDLDILLTENGGPAHLFRNELSAGNSLRIKLEGRESNRDGLSTKVVAYFAGTPTIRFNRTGSSYLSISEKIITLGLPDSAGPDSVRIEWPGGQIEIHHGPFETSELTLTQGTGQAR